MLGKLSSVAEVVDAIREQKVRNICLIRMNPKPDRVSQIDNYAVSELAQ